MPAAAEQDPLTAEYQLINLINQYRREARRPQLQLDANASQVMRQHSLNMLKDQNFSLESKQRGSLDYQLAYGRVSGRSVHSFIALDYDVPNTFQQLKGNAALLSDDVTHAAIGVAIGDHPKYGRTLWTTVVLLQVMATLQNVPRTAEPGTVLKIQAKVSPGFSNPRLPVTVPYGRVLTFYPVRRQGNQAWFEVPLRQGKGRYTFELLLDKTGQGPRVAAILPLYVGVGYPVKEPDETPHDPQTFATTDQASAYLIERINQVRTEHGLRPLLSDQLLTYVAWQHSADMAKNGYFAHVNRQGEDPNARFKRFGGRGPIGENIAFDISIDAAHHHLMSSPGHRANILHEAFTHVGVGVYFTGSHFYVTQLFQRQGSNAALTAPEQAQLVAARR